LGNPVTDAMQQPGKDTPGNPELDAYVAGTASEAEQARFEEALIANPQLAAELDVRQRIKAGLALLDSRGQLQPMLNQPRPPAWRMALAASVAIALVATGWIWRSTNHERELLAQKPALSQASPAGMGMFDGSVILAGVRGAPVKITVDHPGSIIQLRMPLGDPGPDARLRLTTGPVKQAAIPVQASGAYTLVYLDTTGLEPGVHELVLSTGGQDVDTFELEITFRRDTP
jgi:hypothetical protein